MLLQGTKLEDLLNNAQSKVILVAPFVKVATLKRLLEYIDNSVEVQCVTRWRPDEIVVGVSDLEIWPLLKERPSTSLWLRTDLHAKYYRADDQCLVGSANLTATALGWSSRSNLELLVSMPVGDPQLASFETVLFAGCVQVDDSLFEQISQFVQSLVEQKIYAPLRPDFLLDTASSDEVEESITSDSWIPTLRHPEKLYVAYTGDLEKLSTTAKTLALSDLQALDIPADLPKAAFETYVRTLLLQKPIVRKVDEFVTTPQRFGAVRDLLASLPCANNPDFSANEAWQTLMRWLRHFLPDRYGLSVPRHSEVFYRVK